MEILKDLMSRSMFIMIFLKGMRSVPPFDLSGRLFQSLAPLYEKLFWAFGAFLWYFEVCGSISQIVQGIGRVFHKQINQVLWGKSIN